MAREAGDARMQTAHVATTKTPPRRYGGATHPVRRAHDAVGAVVLAVANDGVRAAGCKMQEEERTRESKTVKTGQRQKWAAGNATSNTAAASAAGCGAHMAAVYDIGEVGNWAAS